MTSPTKRALTGTDSRARSPKRRKVDTPAPVNHNEQEIWSVRAILKERKHGKTTRYLIDWEPNPDTGEVYPPNWEPESNVADDLIEAWEARKSKSTRDQSIEPRRPGTLSDAVASSAPRSKAKSLPKNRQVLNRRVLIDSSSEVSSPTQADAPQTWFTPSLASATESSAEDDVDPASPSLEISETQHQSSLPSLSSVPNPFSLPPYTIQIPPVDFDKADYDSFKGSSQFTHSLSSPNRGALTSSSKSDHPTSPQVNLNHSLADHLPPTLSSQSLRTGYLALSQLAQRSPAVSFNNSAPQRGDRLKVPASLETQDAHPAVAYTQNTTSAFKEPGFAIASIINKPSGEEVPEFDLSQYRSTQPSKHSKSHVTTGSQPPASAQVQSVIPVVSTDTTSQGLKPLTSAAISSQPSSSYDFESQLPGVRRRLQSSLRARTRTRTPSQAGSPARSLNLTGLSQPRRSLRSASMDAQPVRQSPRLQSATPVSHSKSPARSSQQNRRARTPQAFDDINTQATAANVTSPLAINPPRIADYSSQPINPSYLSSQAYHNDAAMGVAPYATVYDTPLGASVLPIQQSIEEEPRSSADSIASKASSSQVSLQNERIIPQMDGISLPVQPVIGPGEYVVGLPAEGKIQSIYTDLINAKRKLILKFIHRRGSVGSAQGSTGRTLERNEMIDLMENLQDVTTHMDLGLSGFVTQYSIQSAEAAVYAEYAGSKFGFLGDLIDTMKRVDCGVVIASKPGPVQDLLADFVKMKHVRVHRHDRPVPADAAGPETSQDPLKVDIISTASDKDIHLSATPALMIAFDASFDNQNSQIRRLRELFSRGRDQPLPVVHLLVTNSCEHIDRCMRKAMPSPQRLKLLVRGTYLARANLGGSPTYVPPPPNADGSSAEEVLRDMHDLQRAVRKSPKRKLTSIAATVACAALSADFDDNWNINTLTEVQYDELEDTPPKISESTTAAGTAAPTPRDGRMRTRSPVSRSATPSGKKRMLDVDAASSILSKRQRLTPVRDITPVAEPSRDAVQIEQLQDQLKALIIEQAHEREARFKAEEARNVAVEKLAQSEKKLQEWQTDHAGLLRRYEKQRNHNRTIHNENTRVISANESIKIQAEKVRETNSKLREENGQLKTQLESVRNDMKAGGGDIGALEEARSEARTATQKATVLQKSLDNSKRDFDFTRQQYQQASDRAVQLSGQTTELETEIVALRQKASGEQRRLKELNTTARQDRDREEVEKLAQENRALLIAMKRLDDENKILKKGRGVQTRGSSAQPPGSPGIGGGAAAAASFGRRSRQNSPAVVGSRDDRLAVPGGSSSGHARDRVNAVKNEP